MSATRVTVVKVVQMFAQMNAAEMETALMVLACATLVGVPATVPLQVAVAAMVLATHQMVVVCATTVGPVRTATLSSSVKTRLVPVTAFARTVDAYAVQDIVATHVNQTSGAATVCAESMELAILPYISVCAVVVGLDRGATSKKVRA